MSRKTNCIHLTLLFFLVVSAVGLSACVPSIVADYDRATFEETLRVGREVDLFYGMLLETPENNRSYSSFSERYVTIEADIRSLLARNEARPLNEESTKIVKRILEFWEKYKETHKSQDNYSTGLAKLHRKRFYRLFNAAIEAEAAKKMDTEDANSTNANN